MVKKVDEKEMEQVSGGQGNLINDAEAYERGYAVVYAYSEACEHFQPCPGVITGNNVCDQCVYFVEALSCTAYCTFQG